MMRTLHIVQSSAGPLQPTQLTQGQDLIHKVLNLPNDPVSPEVLHDFCFISLSYCIEARSVDQY